LLKFALLLGAMAVFAALVLASGQSVITEDAARATATLAGGLFTIPLAAAIQT
jgi:hypothetical protein